jgi:hypothetical protein
MYNTTCIIVMCVVEMQRARIHCALRSVRPLSKKKQLARDGKNVETFFGFNNNYSRTGARTATCSVPYCPFSGPAD